MTVPARHRFSDHSRALLTLGLPLVGSNLASFAIHVTDAIMLGLYGVEELAASTLAGTFYFIIFIVGSGFAFAVMPLVAKAAEVEDEVQIRRVTRMGLWLSVLYGLVFIAPLFATEQFFVLIGQDAEVSALADSYLRIICWALAANLLVNVLRSYLSALERTKVLLWVTLGTAVLNVVVNYALIFGNWGMPELGIEGAAIASVATVVSGLVALILYIIWTLPEHSLFSRLWRPDWDAFGAVFRLGVPIGLTALAEGGLFSMSSVMMGWVGTVELAAHGAALQLASVVFVVHMALSQAGTIRAGRAFGRGDGPGLRAGGRAAFFWSMAFVALTVVLFVTIPDLLISIFVDSAEPRRAEVIAVGAGLLLMAALFQLFDALQVMALGLLRGVQDTARPMVMAIFSYWGIGIPFSYLLGFTYGMGGIGIWLGLVIGLAVASVLLNWRFWRRSAWIETP